MTQLDIADRVDKLSKNECYITLKDHKENFQNNPKVRLINPAKTNIGQITKIYLQDINSSILSGTKLNQWKCTSEVINWFTKIENKSRSSFLVLDIVDFYPSISAELLNTVLEYAQNKVHIEQNILKAILNARKTLLFNQGVAWQKIAGLSDVTQGGLDSCQICELVGLYLLEKMRDKFPMMNFGLYRDDGLACHRRIPGPTLERYKKGIIQLFKDNGLKITIETGLKTVDFLDVTFNLATETFSPYKKPNNKLLYVNKQSNHPAPVLNQIPNSVNQRLNTISSNEEIFNSAKKEYENALRDSGYQDKLNYKEKTNEPKKKKNRGRNIIWFNPPFSKSVKTDIGRKFLNLLKKHFPENHKLNKIINKNNVKLSYSVTKNMKRVIQTHNAHVLRKKDTNVDERTCSCPKGKKDECPLMNKCLSKAIVYKATVEQTGKYYIGITEMEFKRRLAKHKHSFKNQADKNSTTLSHHVWESNLAPTPQIKWEVMKKSTARKPGDRECQLCLEEKLQILKQNKDLMCLNKRSELSHRCVIFHRSKHKLSTVV